MTQSSIAFRAVLAVALMIGFCVLAISVAAFLFLVPWLQAYLLRHVFVQISLASVASSSCPSSLGRFAPLARMHSLLQARRISEAADQASTRGQAWLSNVVDRSEKGREANAG